MKPSAEKEWSLMVGDTEFTAKQAKKLHKLMDINYNKALEDYQKKIIERAKRDKNRKVMYELVLQDGNELKKSRS